MNSVGFLTDEEIQKLRETISRAESEIESLTKRVDDTAHLARLSARGDYSDSPFSLVRRDEILKLEMENMDVDLRKSIKDLERAMRSAINNDRDLEEVDRFFVYLWNVKSTRSLNRELSTSNLGDLTKLVDERIDDFIYQPENENVRQFIIANRELVDKIESAILNKLAANEEREEYLNKYNEGLRIVRDTQERCLRSIRSGVELDPSLVPFFNTVANDKTYGFEIDKVLVNGKESNNIQEQLRKFYEDEELLNFYKEVNNYENANLDILATDPVLFKRNREQLAIAKLAEIDKELRELEEEVSLNKIQNAATIEASRFSGNLFKDYDATYSTDYDSRRYKLEKRRELYENLRANYPQTEKVADRIVNFGELSKEYSELSREIDTFKNSNVIHSYNGNRNIVEINILKYQLLQAIVDKKDLENNIKIKRKHTKEEAKRLRELNDKIEELSNSLGMKAPDIVNLRRAKELLFKYNDGIYKYSNVNKFSSKNSRILELEDQISKARRVLHDDLCAKLYKDLSDKYGEDFTNEYSPERFKNEIFANGKTAELEDKLAKESAAKHQQAEDDKKWFNQESAAFSGKSYSEKDITGGIHDYALPALPKHEFKTMKVEVSDTPDKLIFGLNKPEWIKKIQYGLKKRRAQNIDAKLKKELDRGTSELIEEREKLRSEKVKLSVPKIVHDGMLMKRNTYRTIDGALKYSDNFDEIIDDRISSINDIVQEYKARNDNLSKVIVRHCESDIRLLTFAKSCKDRGKLDEFVEKFEAIKAETYDNYDYETRDAAYQQILAREAEITKKLKEIDSKLDKFEKTTVQKYQKSASNRHMRIFDITQRGNEDEEMGIVEDGTVFKYNEPDEGTSTRVLFDDVTVGNILGEEPGKVR